MSDASEVKLLLKQVKSAANKVKTRIGELDDRIAALYARRELLLSQPLSKADYLAAVRADVQAKAKAFRGNMERHLKKYNWITFPALAAIRESGSAVRYLDAGSNTGMEMPESAFYFYFEDQIVAGVERCLEKDGWPDDSVPASEREKLLAGIEAELNELTAERDALANDLISCGVTR